VGVVGIGEVSLEEMGTSTLVHSPSGMHYYCGIAFAYVC
jgi:hypothetical protein